MNPNLYRFDFMTVKELILELEKYDGDCEVVADIVVNRFPEYPYEEKKELRVDGVDIYKPASKVYLTLT